MSLLDYERELGRGLLKSVARSFYLSLRFLPRGMRGPASLGYLLARATDTVADTGAVAAGDRLRLLAAMGDAVAMATPQAAVAGELAAAVADKAESGGEAELLRRFGRCLEWLAAVPEWQRQAVQRVLVPISRGQSDDLQRFDSGGDGGVVVLGSDEELERYTYDVAGCVGVFWTDLGFGAFGERFAKRPRAEMEELGARYGKGLQLLNILRDFPEDLATGRCYLPGVDPANTGEAIWAGEAERWRLRCRDHLAAAPDYLAALRGRRLRFATALPALIGGRTLDLLDAATWQQVEARVKVPRPEVKRLMLRAVFGRLAR